MWALCQIAATRSPDRSRARASQASRRRRGRALRCAALEQERAWCSRSTSGTIASRACARRTVASSSSIPELFAGARRARERAGARRAPISRSCCRPASAARSPPTRSFATPTGARRTAPARCACIPSDAGRVGVANGGRVRLVTRARQRRGLGRDLRSHAARTRRDCRTGSASTIPTRAARRWPPASRPTSSPAPRIATGWPARRGTSTRRRGWRRCERRVPLRLRFAERLSRAPRHSRDRAAHRRRLRLRPGAPGRRLQGDRQRLAGGLAARGQEQGRVRGARDATVPREARHHALRAQSVLPGEHAADHARRRGGATPRLLRHVRRRGLPAHVGGAQENGRA